MTEGGTENPALDVSPETLGGDPSCPSDKKGAATLNSPANNGGGGRHPRLEILTKRTNEPRQVKHKLKAH